MVIVDHPLGGISDADVAQRIDAAYEQTVALLEAEDDLGPATADVSANGSSNGSPNGSGTGVTGTSVAAAPAGTGEKPSAPTPESADSGVDAALEELRSALASDGAGLAVASADKEKISVELTFTDETCMDCVIPPPTLEAIISDTLQRSGYEQSVSVLDPRV